MPRTSLMGLVTTALVAMVAAAIVSVMTPALLSTTGEQVVRLESRIAQLETERAMAEWEDERSLMGIGGDGDDPLDRLFRSDDRGDTGTEVMERVDASLLARIEALEAAMARPRSSQTRPDADGPGDAPPWPEDGGEPSDTFRDAVRTVIEDYVAEREAAARAERLERERREFLAAVAEQLDRAAGPLGLTDRQQQDLLAVAETHWEAQQALRDQYAGVDVRALTEEERAAIEAQVAAIERDSQARIRDTMTEAQYRDYRAAERRRDYQSSIRGGIRAIPDLEGWQMEEIRRELDAHVDRIADADVRLASEELTEAEREQLEELIEMSEEEALRRVMEGVLTPAQRHVLERMMRN